MNYSNGIYLLVIVWTSVVQFCLGEQYNVAVMEFAPNLNLSQPTNDILEENSKNYLKLIEDVTQNQALDLIIFPESTLTPPGSFTNTATQLPNSSDIVLCNSTDDKYLAFLKELSCAAIRHNTIIVINFTEKELSNSTDVTLYNTNVALGTNGTVIARYRKWNLFGEYYKSKPTTLDLPVFTIKNTTFGMMTCFDIQFGNPAFNLTKSKGVKNVIFPLQWISELPYLTALQVEQMWAQEFNVVLLASGASLPQSGAGGSGIFYGNQGPIESVILPEAGRRVLIHSVPSNVQLQNNTETSVDDLAASMDDFFMLVDPSIKDHNSVVLVESEETVNTTVCHGEDSNVLCCEFNVSLSRDTKKTSFHYTYLLVAFNGVRTYSGLYYGGVETCGIVACLNSSILSCGQRFQTYLDIVWPLTFTSISIKGNFTLSDQRVQFPTTLLSSIYPLPIQEYTWERQDTESTVIRKLTLQTPQNRLLTFGIFGRDFDRDWDPLRNNTSRGNTPCKFCRTLFLLIITALLLVHISYVE